MNIMQEDKILANDVLERHFYTYFRDNPSKKSLEIFLTGACHSNCEYCYLKKNLKHLYPVELHNYEIITNNVDKILKWYIKNQFKCEIQIFSGEWLTLPLADKIIDIFYKNFKDTEFKPPVILCPDNMQFLKNEETTKKVEGYISLMKSIGIDFALSASVDGFYCEFGRTPVEDEFYTKLKNFSEKYNVLPHPMISATNVKYWINNFEWWKNTFGESAAYNMTILEVRNEQWTLENIQDLIVFCDYLVDTTFKDLNNNKEELFKYVFNVTDSKDKSINNTGYNPIRLTFNYFTCNQDSLSCSNQKNLCIRAGDLTVAPCHRLYYPLLELGKYNVENNEITDFEPTNVSLLIAQRYLKRTCLPICENCGLVGFCPGFCLGASYEEYRNMLVPQKEVCEMYKAKYAFLIWKYNQIGLFDDKALFDKYFDKESARYIKDLIASILQEESL